MGNVLVVYDAQGRSTRRVACEIARVLHADLEELCPIQERSKILSFLRPASIERPQHDPSKFDLVVLGAPVRDDSLSNAVRAYLRHLGPKIPRLAVVSIGDHIDALHLSRQIHALSGRAPVAEITLQESERAVHTEAVKCERFVEAVRRVLTIPSTRVCQAG